MPPLSTSERSSSNIQPQFVTPSGRTWTVLKSSFIFVNFLIFLEFCFLLYVCIGLFLKDYHGRPGIPPDWMKPYFDQFEIFKVQQCNGRIMICALNGGIVIALLALQLGLLTIGLFGILKIKLRYLYAFLELMGVSLITSLVLIFISSLQSQLVPLIESCVKCLIIALTGKIIKVIEELNDIS